MSEWVTYKQDCGNITIKERGGRAVAIVQCSLSGKNRPKHEERAQKIAAVPDLIEALITFIEVGDCKASRDKATAALNKALRR